MKTLTSKKNAVAAAVAFIAALTGTVANASVIYEFSNTSTATYANSSTLSNTDGIFATAAFTDVSKGLVELTLTVLGGLASNNYVDGWTFNLGGPSTSISSITYASGVAGTTSFASATKPITSTSNNVLNGGTSGGSFDLGFSFAGLTPKELDSGSSATYRLSGSNNFSASDFLTANNSGIFAAVHVAGGNTNTYFKALNTDGVATPAANVPEPTTVALLGLGLLGFAASRRKSAKSKNA